MREEIQNRIVRLALPTISKGVKAHRYFSGYILGNGILITCRHGFAAADGAYDNQRPILVHIRSQGAKDTDYEITFQATTLQGLLDEEGILFASEEYDIVLLHCEQAAANIDLLLLNELEEPGDWKGGGYPYYNRETQDTDGLELFSGTFEAPAAGGKHLQLNVTTTLPCMRDWREASGSPIFIQGKLAGILRRYFEYDSERKKEVIPNRLTAVYLKRLWDGDEEFRRILQKFDTSYSTKSEKILKLADQMLNEKANLKKALGGSAEPGQVVRELVQQSLPDFLEYIEQLDTNQEDRRTLALALLPWYFINQSVVIDRSAEGAIDIDCICDVAAECSMAAFDCRKAYVTASRPAGKTKQDYRAFVMRGRFALSSPPENGIDKDGIHVFDVLNKNILSTSALDNLLAERFAKDQPGFNPKNLVNGRLSQARKEGNSFYLIVRFGSEELKKLAKYAEEYPNLIILNLAAGNPDLEKAELPLLINLPALIAERKHDEE